MKLSFFSSPFFALPKLVSEILALTKKGKTPPNKLQKLPKKGKTVINCAFLCSKTQILRDL